MSWKCSEKYLKAMSFLSSNGLSSNLKMLNTISICLTNILKKIKKNNLIVMKCPEKYIKAYIFFFLLTNGLSSYLKMFNTLAIYQIILHLNKITECLKMTTFKIVFTLDVFWVLKPQCTAKDTFQSALLFTITISDPMIVTWQEEQVSERQTT